MSISIYFNPLDKACKNAVGAGREGDLLQQRAHAPQSGGSAHRRFQRRSLRGYRKLPFDRFAHRRSLYVYGGLSVLRRYAAGTFQTVRNG